ncbi:MAG: DoxX family protein [Cyclobacteriaceae bacterium]
MILKIINSALMLFAAFMGVKHGWGGLTAKPEVLHMFHKWNIGKYGVMTIGFFTILSAVLMLIPKTFLWGNFLMAAGILLMMCLHLHDRDLKGAAIEIPFLLLSLVIIYLRHPLAQGK